MALRAHRRTLFHVGAVLALLAACSSPGSVDPDGGAPAPGEGDGEGGAGDDATSPNDAAVASDAEVDADAAVDAPLDAPSDADATMIDAGHDSSVPLDSWTWMGGATTLKAANTFGTKGVPDPANTPGYRGYAATWRDASDALWLFGGLSGSSYDSDLWRFDGTSWTWVAGNTPSWGTLGVPAATNNPGGRFGSACWIDASGKLWLYGGYGPDVNGLLDGLSDLWRWDGTYWTWMAGPNTAGQVAVFGTKGVADPANTPGAMVYAMAWADAAGKVWLFGGETIGGSTNALWSWDGAKWTWVDGHAGVGGTPTYIVHGAPGSYPGAREKAAYARDASGTFWMYGGFGDGSNGGGDLGDLWKFDGAWTWVAGASTHDPVTVYGTKGVASATNDPGGLADAALFATSGGIFLATGWDTSANRRNAVFRFDGTSWTWIAGSSTANQNGVYGTKGVSQSFDIMGSRRGAAYWSDSYGVLWFFGGDGYDQTDVTAGGLNDLWRYRP